MECSMPIRPFSKPTCPARNLSLLAYGLARTNYILQSTTNLSGTVAWYPQLHYTLTNSFLWIANPGGGAPDVFYRIKRP